MLLNFAKENNVKDDIISGNLTAVQEYAQKQIQNGVKDENLVAGLIDSAALNPVWRDQFTKAFSAEYGHKVNFDVLSEEDKASMKNYTITGGVSGTNISDLFETTILPIIDGLLIDNSPILSRVSRIPTGLNDGNQSFDLNEFGAESSAESLDEDDAGTEADDTPRNGDTITPKNKIQASTSFTEYSLATMQPTLLAQFMARGVRRVETRLGQQILAGTNASNQFKGIINSAGSTEDDQEGALAFAYGAATDNLDYVLKAVGNLPNSITQGEESRFVYIMTRSDFYNKIALIQDLDTNYKRAGVIDTNPGTRSIGGFPVIFAGSGLSANQVVFADLSNYYLAQKGSLRMISDNGLANVKTGNVTVAFRTYADGGMVYAHKNTVGGGAGTNGNAARNAFRLLTLA